jgi:hypothetical protein
VPKPSNNYGIQKTQKIKLTTRLTPIEFFEFKKKINEEPKLV